MSLFHRSAVHVLLVASVVSPVAPPSAAEATGGGLVIEGKGWGHGVGLAQDGALAMGRAGADVTRILDHFYPGTTDGSAAGAVRVVASTGAAHQAVLSFPGGGELRTPGRGPQPPGFPVVVPASTPVTVSVDGGRTVVNRPASSPPIRPANIHGTTVPVVLLNGVREIPTSDPGATTTTLPTTTTGPPPTAIRQTPPPTKVSPPGPRPAAPPPPATPVAPPPPGGDQAPATSGPVVAVPPPGGTTLLVDRQRRYRGTLEVGGLGGGARVVNELDVEDYLRGMGEVREPSWPPAALQAQAVAARTYALHAMAADGEICADDRCQVYLSADVEYPAMDDAVRVTNARVRRTGTDLATTFYSANGGGVSATAEEGFGPGGTDLPYLRAAPYLTEDPDPWTVRVDLAEAARMFNYRGRLSGAHVNRLGPSGRALEVTLDGDGGPLIVRGQAFAARLQLRSTLFSLRGAPGGAEVAPPAPLTPGADLLAPGNRPAGAASSRSNGGSGTRAAAAAALLVGAMVVVQRRRAVAHGATQ